MRARALSGAAILFAVFCLFLIVRFFFFSSWDTANIPPKNETIVAFGDSLVYGVGATRGNDFVSLLEKQTGRDIVNLGVPGNTTKDGLNRIDEVLKLDPGIIILLLGGNDALRRITKEETNANLSALLSQFVDNGSAVILVGVRGGLLGDPYDEMYEDLAREYGAILVPNVLEDILLRPELTEDQIHPNNEGYVIVANRIYKKLEPLLSE